MSKQFYYFSWLVMLSFFGLVIWFYYQLLFPFDVLLVKDIHAYKPSFLDRLTHLVVIEQPFLVESPIQQGGHTARFKVEFIYNFGNPPDIVALLKCEDGTIYEVEKVGEIPKLIGEPGVLNSGISDYNLINDRASGKTCHMEFDAEWKTQLQSIHKKVVTTDFYVE